MVQIDTIRKANYITIQYKHYISINTHFRHIIMYRKLHAKLINGCRMIKAGFLGHILCVTKSSIGFE